MLNKFCGFVVSTLWRMFVSTVRTWWSRGKGIVPGERCSKNEQATIGWSGPAVGSELGRTISSSFGCRRNVVGTDA